MEKLTEKVLGAIENSPGGITTLGMLESLGLCDESTLKTTLSRLNKAGKILRLKRGAYSAKPLKDAFAAAQAVFNGYIGFGSALYLHRLISEIPFVITIVTTDESASKTFGSYEFRAVALKEKAVGFENVGGLVVSSRAKTLFDCVYLERYSIEREKLIGIYRDAMLVRREWEEFDSYVGRFAAERMRGRFRAIKKEIMKKEGG